MFPMNFKEFLIAMNEEKYVELFSKWDVNRPVPDIYSKPMRELLFTYYTVGGMPDAVAEFSKTKKRGENRLDFLCLIIFKKYLNVLR